MDRAIKTIDPIFWRRKALAEALGVHVRTVDRFAKNGTLPPPRLLGEGIKGWTNADIETVINNLQRSV